MSPRRLSGCNFDRRVCICRDDLCDLARGSRRQAKLDNLPQTLSLLLGRHTGQRVNLRGGQPRLDHSRTDFRRKRREPAIAAQRALGLAQHLGDTCTCAASAGVRSHS